MTVGLLPVDRAPQPELRSALGPLWPDLGQAGSATEWAVLPRPSEPRLLVPLGTRRAAAQTISEQRRTASGRARLAGAVLSTAVRYGPGTVLLRRRGPVGTGDVAGTGLVGRLEELLDCRLEVAVYLGVPRRNRKPVLKLYDRGGRLRGIAKVGVDALTGALVRNEHAALARLGPRADVVEVPTALELLEWDDSVVLVQSALSVGNRRRHRPTTGDLQVAAGWLAADTTASRLAVVTSSWWQTVVERAVTAPDGVVGDRLRAVVGHGAAGLEGVSLLMAPWHGDLTPWNMAATGGRPQVWDWERYAPQAPVGCDVLHFTLQASAYQAADIGAVMRTGLQRAAEILHGTTPRGDAVIVGACYALELSSRYVTEGQALFPRGGQAATALLDHAERVLATPDARPEPA